MMCMSEQPTTGIPAWTIGDRLRKALEEAGIGNQEMADYLEVSRNTIGAYIHDRTRIPGPALRLWAMRTGVPIEWLRTGEGEAPHMPGGGGKSGGTCGYLDRPVSLAA